MKKNIKYISIVLILFLFMVGVTSTVSATDRNMTPTQFLGNITAQTIHEGDNITLSGDTVTVNQKYTVSTNNIIVRANTTGTVLFKGGTSSAQFYITGKNVTLQGITFTDFHYSSSAAGTVAWQGDNGTLRDCNFTNNRIDGDNGGAIHWSGANGRVENSYFINNTANSNGGALYWANDDGCVIGSYFFNNTAKTYGGAIYWNSKRGYVENCIFSDNNATCGGAIYCLADIAVANCTFDGNNATEYGGAMYVGSSLYYLNQINCTFEDNNAKYGGGAIYTESIRIWNQSSCIFEGNSAGTNGGTIAVNADLCYWSQINCTFIGSNASNGGVIYVKSVGNWSQVNCTFEDNTASYGGTIYADNTGNWSQVSCTFEDNTAFYGGAIYVDSAVNWMQTNCIFENNNASSFGGAIVAYTQVYDWTQVNCTFEGNNATEYAGAIYVYTMGNWSQVNCTFEGNNATEYAGAIYIEDTVNTWSQVNCSFESNSAGIDGGAIVVDNIVNTWSQVNCSFESNSAGTNGGAITVNNDVYDWNQTNCTFEGNKDINGADIYNKKSITISGDSRAVIYSDGVITNTLTVIILGNKTVSVAKNQYTELSAFIKLGNYTVIGGLFKFVNNIGDTIANLTGDHYTASYNVTGDVGDKIILSGFYRGSVIYETATLIIKNAVSITGNNVTLPYNKKIEITLNVTSCGVDIPSGNVSIIIEETGEIFNGNVSDGKVTIEIPRLNVGIYDLTAFYEENEEYVNNTFDLILNITQNNPILNITITPVTYGDNVTVLVNVTGEDGAGVNEGNVSFILNDKTYSEKVVDGKVSITVTDLSADTYDILVNYNTTTGNYCNLTENANINVSRANPNFNIDNINYGDDKLSISTNSTVSGNITVIINKMKKTIDIVNGSADLNITEWNLGAGEYIADIIYSGDHNYENITVQLEFAIGKGNATFKIDNITYADGVIIINSNSTINGNITVTIGEETKTVSIVNGSADLNISEWGLAVGDYVAKINFTGNANYTGVITEVNFSIEKSKTFIDIAITEKDNSVLITLNLTDSRENPISGNVTISITSDNGYKHTETVYLINGTKSLELSNLSDGKYNVTATYNATEDYESSFNNNSFVINNTGVEYYLNATNVVKYYLNDTHYHVTLTDQYGNPVAGKTILVTLNCSRWANKQYNITTNASGIATLKINLYAGFYTITANFENATPITTNITVKDIFETQNLVKYYKNGTHFTVNVTDNAGNPAINKTVTLKVFSEKWSTSVTYTVKTNASGIAVLPINLLSGVYSISTTVEGITKYNNIAVLPTLTANNLVKKTSQAGNLTARLVDGQGNPVEGKDIQFTVKTKTYSFKTDSEGIATLPIHLGLGTWSFLISSDNVQTRATVKIVK